MISFLKCIKSIHFEFFDLFGAFTIFSVIICHVIELSAWKTFLNLSDRFNLDLENWPYFAAPCGRFTRCRVQLLESLRGNIGAKS